MCRFSILNKLTVFTKLSLNFVPLEASQTFFFFARNNNDVWTCKVGAIPNLGP
jgi:hypothetical protein